MKKILATALIALVCLTVFAGCQLDNPDEKTTYTLVAPDGAPALAVSELLATSFPANSNEYAFDYKIVSASDVQNYVVGNVNAHADVALLPVNLASKLLGSGDEYKMVGVVTHGNLYLLSKNGEQITAQNAKTALQGKSIAVVNLSAVPGLTTKAMLVKLGLSYTEDKSQFDGTNVFLKGINGTEIATSLNSLVEPVDYVVAPEPAVSTVTSKAPAIKKVGALHEVYGGYPQAVMVVKSQLLQQNPQLVKELFEVVSGATSYLKANTNEAVEAVASHLVEGNPSFTAENTTLSVIDGCSINLQPMTQQMIEVVEGYISAIMAVNPQSASEFAQEFFVDITKLN